MAELLKGAPAAKALTEELLLRSQALSEKGITPALAIVRVGERPDDISYETGALKRCEKTGVAVRRFLLPEDAGIDEISKVICEINEDESIHGCLMFRPLKDKAAEAEACRLLDPAKDIDGMTDGSLAAVFKGSGAGYAPCTASAVMELIRHCGIELKGKKVVVVGRSLVIGKPVSMLLQKENATVTMCHSKTADLKAECRNADILVAAIGRAEMLDKDYIPEQGTVIDVGINVNADGKLCGDVRFEDAERAAAAVTPVPGGVGAVTTAVLCKHVIEAAEIKAAAKA